MVNPGGEFIKKKVFPTSNGEVSNCIFILNDNAPGYVVESRKTQFAIYCDEIAFLNTSLTGNQKVQTIMHYVRSDHEQPFLWASKYAVKNSSFTGVQNLFTGVKGSAVLSSFEHCGNIFNGETSIEDCRFDNCINVGQGLNKSSHIANCQFNSCVT